MILGAVAEDVDADRFLSLGGSVSFSSGRANKKPDRGISALRKQGKKNGLLRKKSLSSQVPG